VLSLDADSGNFRNLKKLWHLLDKNSAQTEKQPVVSNCALNWSEKDLLLVRVAGILEQKDKKLICTPGNYSCPLLISRKSADFAAVCKNKCKEMLSLNTDSGNFRNLKKLLDKNSIQMEKKPSVSNRAMDRSEKDLSSIRVASQKSKKLIYTPRKYSCRLLISRRVLISQ